MAPDANTAADFRDALLRVGIDTVRYFTNSIDGLPTFVPELISPAELAETNYDALIDIRAKSGICRWQHSRRAAAFWRFGHVAPQ